VTGASSGIGRELARLFAADGHDLVLVARRRGELESLAAELGGRHGVRCTVIARDLSRPGEGTTIYGEVEASELTVDVLVNNAGFGAHGAFTDLDLQRQMQMLRVNCEALTELTWRFLPGMIEAGYGRVLNVASTAAFQPGPYMAVYYASKAYVLSLGEALADELRETGVTVTTLCPGSTATDFRRVAGQDGLRLLRIPGPDVEAVARAGYEGMWRGKRLVVPGLINRIAAQAVRFGPRRLVTRVVRSANSR